MVKVGVQTARIVTRTIIRLARVFICIGDLFLFKVTPEVLAVLHLGWILVLVVGFVYTIFDHNFAWTLIILNSLNLLLLLILRFCPVTKLEEKLRRRKSPDFSFQNSFSTFYLNKIFKTRFSARKVNIATVIVFCLSYAIAVLALTGLF